MHICRGAMVGGGFSLAGEEKSEEGRGEEKSGQVFERGKEKSKVVGEDRRAGFISCICENDGYDDSSLDPEFERSNDRFKLWLNELSIWLVSTPTGELYEFKSI